MWRRQATVDAVVAWRAPRDAVRAVLDREAVPAALGPERDGWTVARVLVNGDQVVEPRERRVRDLVDDLARSLGAPGATCLVGDWGGRLLVVCSGSAAPVEAELPPLTSAEPPERSDWADALRELGTLDRLVDVLDAATIDVPANRRTRTAAAARDDRPVRVAAAAGLPAQLLDPRLAAPPEPHREVVVCRDMDPEDPRVAASMLQTALRVTDLGGAALVTADPVDGVELMPVAASIASGRRSALVLWRQGDVRGYQLVHKGEIEDVHLWTQGWDVVGLPADQPEFAAELRSALEPTDGDAELLLRRFGGQPGATPVDVRTVLRRPPSGRAVEDLCLLLGVNPVAADVVEGTTDPADLPRSERVTPTSAVRAILEAATTPRPDDPWVLRVAQERRWWYRVLQVLSAVIAGGFAVGVWDTGWGARAGSVALAVVAVGCLVDAVLPGRTAPDRAGVTP
jgi:hypothetical protein